MRTTYVKYVPNIGSEKNILQVTYDEADQSIRKHINEGEKIRYEAENAHGPKLNELREQFTKWYEESFQILIESLFKPYSEIINHFDTSAIRPNIKSKTIIELIDTRIGTSHHLGSGLIGIQSRLKLYPSKPPPPETRTSQNKKTMTPVNKKVFIVHGQDESPKNTVSSFLKELKLEPIILHEKPNSGRTIIEKFEHESSNVSFAIVLLTPDDIGGPRSCSKEDYELRARQNVILELGFFMGKLGRDRVCTIYWPDVILPSDYQGVTYIPYSNNSQDWKEELKREITNAGFKIESH